MTLGERILQYRTARNWSQEDLASALEVSRQSVSKWETDASTPDLNKIIRMSEIFNVTLDELVTGKAPPDAPPSSPSPTPAQAAPAAASKPAAGKVLQTVLGAILLCFGFLIGLLLLLLNGGGFALILMAPFLLCGVICLTARRRAGLLCGWTLYLWLDFYLRGATGITWSIIFLTPQYQPEWNYTRLYIGWFIFLWALILLLLTARSYRELQLPPVKANLFKLFVLLAAVVLCPVLLPFLPNTVTLFGVNLINYLINTAQILLLAWAIVLGAAMLRGHQKQRGA